MQLQRSGRPTGPPIDRVADHRTAKFGGMHADLMGAPGLRRKFNETDRAVTGHHPIVGGRRLAAGGVDHHAPTAPRGADLVQGRGDAPTGRRRHTVEHGPIGFSARPSEKIRPRRRRALRCRPSASTRKCPDPSDGQARRLGQAEAQSVEIEFQMIAAARATVDRQAGRFVENDDQTVTVEDAI